MITWGVSALHLGQNASTSEPISSTSSSKMKESESIVAALSNMISSADPCNLAGLDSLALPASSPSTRVKLPNTAFAGLQPSSHVRPTAARLQRIESTYLFEPLEL